MENKKKILVVDDNPTFCQLLQCAFEDEYPTFRGSYHYTVVVTAFLV